MKSAADAASCVFFAVLTEPAWVLRTPAGCLMEWSNRRCRRGSRPIRALSVVLLLGLSGCTAGVVPDTPAEPLPVSVTISSVIEDQEVAYGDTTARAFALSDYFEGATAYEASSSDTTIADTAVANGVLTVTPGSPGEAQITVIASNDDRQTPAVSQSFAVSVKAPAERPVGGPALSPGRSWKYVWGDEFDGDTLNRDRWGSTPYSWGSDRLKNVSVSDGHLILANTRHESEEGVTYDTSAASSRPEPGSSRTTRANVGFETVYGYFEARIELPPTAAGIHAAFWLQSYRKNPDGNYAGVEIDILEAPSWRDWYQVAIHKRIKGRPRISWTNRPALDGLHNGFHVFAVHWQHDRYDFYANGNLVATYDGPHISHIPQFIYLTTGFHWYWDGVDRPELFPNRARVDWVRVWKVVEEWGNDQASTAWENDSGAGESPR